MQQFLGAFTAARVTYGGFYMLGAVGALFNVALAAPLGLLAGMTLGRRLVKTERERQVQQRRHQAKQRAAAVRGRRRASTSAATRREAVRRTQRFLRDEFAARAQAVERSAAATAGRGPRAPPTLPDRTSAGSGPAALAEQRAGSTRLDVRREPSAPEATTLPARATTA